MWRQKKEGSFSRMVDLAYAWGIAGKRNHLSIKGEKHLGPAHTTLEESTERNDKLFAVDLY